MLRASEVSKRSEGRNVSVSLVRDLCFVDLESNCLCAREDGRGVVDRGQSFAQFIIPSVLSVGFLTFLACEQVPSF